ncbi:MAG: recombinase family protein [Clostridia bacterium]|nr:recombinase family protein [Clostridia bacterium]
MAKCTSVKGFSKEKELGKRAVIYARFSSDAQKEVSIDRQIEACQQYIEYKGYELVDTYTDYARSASHDTQKRTNFIRMLNDSDDKEFDVVVAYALNRISRERNAKYYTYKDRLESNNVRIEYATETNDNAIAEAVQVHMSSEYVVQLRTYTVDGMRKNAEKGYFNGGYLPPGIKAIDAGKEGKEYAIDEETAPYIRNAFDMYVSGISTSHIAAYLNGHGVRNGKGNKMTANNVNTFIKNPIYIGIKVSVFDNEAAQGEITTEEIFEPIIPVDVWNKAQIVHQKRHHKGKTEAHRDQYILRGKLFCGTCGEEMVVDAGTSRGNDRNKTKGKTKYYYTCRNRKYWKKYNVQKCSKKPVGKEFVENAVLQIVTDFIWNEEEIAAITKKLEAEEKKKGPSPHKKEVQNLLIKHRSELNAYMDAYAKTLNDIWLTRVDEQTAIIKDLETELKDINRIEKTEMSAEDFYNSVMTIKAAWDSLRSTADGRLKIVDRFVERVYIYDADPQKPNKYTIKVIIRTDPNSDFNTEVTVETDVSSIMMTPGSPSKQLTLLGGLLVFSGRESNRARAQREKRSGGSFWRPRACRRRGSAVSGRFSPGSPKKARFGVLFSMMVALSGK